MSCDSTIVRDLFRLSFVYFCHLLFIVSFCCVHFDEGVNGVNFAMSNDSRLMIKVTQTEIDSHKGTRNKQTNIPHLKPRNTDNNSDTEQRKNKHCRTEQTETLKYRNTENDSGTG